MAVTIIDGDKISYHTFGDGVPMVMIPPPVVGSIVFERQIETLASHCRLILVELRGHGKSSMSKDGLTYPVIARDIAGLLDALHLEQAIVCGYSMGASVVFEFARMFPDRTLGGIPISGFSEATDFRFRTEIRTAISVAKVGAMRTLAFGLSLANADNLQSLQHMFQFGLRANRRDVMSMFEYALHFNCTDDLANIQTPMRLIFGSNDSRLYKYQYILERRLPNKEVFQIPGARHQIPLKHHRQLNQLIIEFIHQLGKQKPPQV